MKAFTLILLGGALTAAAVSVTAYAAEIDQTAAEHLAKAASFEEKAKGQETVIADHQKQKKIYRRSHPIKGTRPPVMARVLSEHDAVIREARKLRDDYLDFARWHRMQAADLKEQPKP